MIDAIIEASVPASTPSPFTEPAREQAWLKSLRGMLATRVNVRDAAPTEAGYAATAQLQWSQEDLLALFEDLTTQERTYLLQGHRQALDRFKRSAH